MPHAPLNLSELEKLFELSIDLLCVADVQGFFLQVNPAFSHVLGYAENELLDRPFIEFVHCDDREKTLAALESLSRGKTIVAFENRYRCKDGEFKTLQWNATPDQHSESIFASARDVSKEYELQREFEESRQQRAIGTVATTIAHDINNLLTPIIAMTELLLHLRREDQQVENAAKLILTSAERGADLVNQIHIFSEESSVAFSEVRLDLVVEEVIQALNSSSTISLKVELSNSVVWGNATQLYQMVMNLCRNAVQAKSVDSAIQINLFHKPLTEDSSTLANQQQVVLEVVNQGPSIPTEVLNRIFEPFYTTRKNDGGTGLGLAIVMKVVEAHGGRIQVNSLFGQTKFSVTLPTPTG